MTICNAMKDCVCVCVWRGGELGIALWDTDAANKNL